MRQPQVPQKQGFLDSARAGLTVGLFLCRTLAVSLEVFLHSGIGDRYLGLQALAVLVVVPLYMLFWPGYDLRPMTLFWWAYIVMCGIGRLGTIGKRLRGEHGHSRYTGWPRGMTGRGQWSEITVKRIVEPVFVFVWGCIIRQLNPPLGTYLMLAAGSLFISVSADEAEERVRVMDMNDAVIDQEGVADKFRHMRLNRE